LFRRRFTPDGDDVRVCVFIQHNLAAGFWLMTTAVEIANMALSLIGSANRITVLDGSGSEENRQCFLHYEPARDALLRSHSWNFAVTRVQITTTAAGTPPFG
jgi:hypothetical protein